jgi:hypothetical protein
MLIRKLFIWHRLVGVTCALLMVLLAITGLALNHTEQFELDKKRLQNRWLLNWYGISRPPQLPGYKLQEQWLTPFSDALYLNGSKLGGSAETLRGAVISNEMVLVALADRIYLLTVAEELIEILTPQQGLPKNLQQIGLDKSGYVVLFAEGQKWLADEMLLTWQPTETKVTWSQPQTYPLTIYQNLVAEHSGEGLSLERITLDLHSGRFFGSWGIWLMDLVAIAMILLALSGITIWLRIKWLKVRKTKQPEPAHTQT